MDSEIKTLKKEIEKLKEKIKILEIENKKLKKSQKSKAGRKKKFTEQEREMIKMYRFQGKTIKELSISFNCSIGLIHKIINE